MVATVVAATVDPLIVMRHLLNTLGLPGNVDRFIICHGLTSMDDFEYIHHNRTHQVVKMDNDRYQVATQKIGFPVQRKIKELLY